MANRKIEWTSELKDKMIDICLVIYEAKGYEPVLSLGEMFDIPFEYCKYCEMMVPVLNGICLVCGSEVEEEGTVFMARMKDTFKDGFVKIMDNTATKIETINEWSSAEDDDLILRVFCANGHHELEYGFTKSAFNSFRYCERNKFHVIESDDGEEVWVEFFSRDSE